MLTDGAAPVMSLWAELDYASADSAREALAGREGCNVQAVGLWPGAIPAHNIGAAQVATWAKAKGLDAAVWTALPPKFNDISGQAPVSAEAAVAYLKNLNSAAAVAAREYVERAPAQVRTPFRVAFKEQLGWTFTG